ncbi:PPK2 family polyphosphate kinase [Undibacterium oligocarboniphilum]|uniref:Polyphosphate kinase 2 family protein n=1 Tax=Undibacterium oligocarboniphilum TaxID=666702 RepID=A0A850QFP1_9BURK|nr:PPK2 family polyphosphate kinase [Undibacterium oligocarboniphilum]MBC3869388.1 polyphosphate kinase 2 family protein [Undibacterium oligocarboniphilum]NVO77767.1 polyphosphate kinase 2 family protein [Undibacterium oligocarboniphilum]
MDIAGLCRLRSGLVLKEADAARKLTGAVAAGMTDGKAIDKLQTLNLAEKIAEIQNVFVAAKQYKLLIILQGMDTSGKDGTVKGVFGQINPLGTRTVAFKAPVQVEKDHDYLWRVHREVPGSGEIVIFNRSHYEDVLISKVHGWISEETCLQRYAHIRDFERMLSETGTIILKFFLHLSKAEQKHRLEERLADPDKYWKFDPQDLAERTHWDAYQRAYEHALAATDSDNAPWFVIPSDSKTQRNLLIAGIVLEKLESLKLKYPPMNPAYRRFLVE